MLIKLVLWYQSKVWFKWELSLSSGCHLSCSDISWGLHLFCFSLFRQTAGTFYLSKTYKLQNPDLRHWLLYVQFWFLYSPFQFRIYAEWISISLFQVPYKYRRFLHENKISIPRVKQSGKKLILRWENCAWSSCSLVPKRQNYWGSEDIFGASPLPNCDSEPPFLDKPRRIVALDYDTDAVRK